MLGSLGGISDATRNNVHNLRQEDFRGDLKRTENKEGFFLQKSSGLLQPLSNQFRENDTGTKEYKRDRIIEEFSWGKRERHTTKDNPDQL